MRPLTVSDCSFNAPLTHSPHTQPASLWSIIQACFHPLPSSVQCPLGSERSQRSLRPNAHRWMMGVAYPAIFAYLNYLKE
ncbi:hypothetical protein F7725_009684 [Dissostichus mawsoni]|uniref:Uncharacterized protein n=1 Tax=Dissostichus mawsoni TaxID=36200 RepID=A0A7J5XLD1_DISMA|nr:hypothetical protein F7725_009684 [Dissostichus mawsoni]